MLLSELFFKKDTKKVNKDAAVVSFSLLAE